MTTPTPTPSATSPPTQALLPLLFPHVLSALHKSAHLALALSRYTLNLFVRFPWATLISPLTYLLAPLTTFTSIIVALTVRTPYNLILWLLDALFPVYVLCGVACITGSVLGLGGRALSLSLVRAVSKDSIKEEGEREHYNDLVPKIEDEDDFVERSFKRRRIDKKDKEGRVKFEFERPRTVAFCTDPFLFAFPFNCKSF